MWTAFFTVFLSPCPMACAMTTFAPSAIPTKRFTSRLMIGLFAPTAATAAVRCAPVKLPTIAMSEALKSCSRIAVAATGRANSGILFQMAPWSMSSSRFAVFAFMFASFFNM